MVSTFSNTLILNIIYLYLIIRRENRRCELLPTLRVKQIESYVTALADDSNNLELEGLLCAGVSGDHTIAKTT
jgi:hypothetical protein